MTDIPLASYVAASTLGMLPTAILNCYMGTTLRSMNDILTDETNQTTGWIVLVVQVSCHWIIWGNHGYQSNLPDTYIDHSNAFKICDMMPRLTNAH